MVAVSKHSNTQVTIFHHFDRESIPQMVHFTPILQAVYSEYKFKANGKPSQILPIILMYFLIIERTVFQANSYKIGKNKLVQIMVLTTNIIVYIVHVSRLVCSGHGQFWSNPLHYCIRRAVYTHKAYAKYTRNIILSYVSLTHYNLAWFFFQFYIQNKTFTK